MDQCYYSKENIRKYIGNTKQLFGIKSYTFDEGREKGIKTFEINTGAGLNFTVMPDRCMDIFYAQFLNCNISYISNTGIVSPYYYIPIGDEWLRGFGGGLLATCGLTQVGQDDAESCLHGRIGNTPAYDVCHSTEWVNDKYVMTVSGKVRESVLYGENIVLKRVITATAGEAKFLVHDEFENEGCKDFQLLVLYHCNFGYPLLDEGAKLVADINRTEPRDELGKQFIKEVMDYKGPQKDGHSLVYFHDMIANENGEVIVKLVNEAKNLCVYLKYFKDELPYFAQWKNTGEQEYVTGLEPCTSLPIGRKDNIKNGYFKLIKPGQTVKIDLEIGIFTPSDT